MFSIRIQNRTINWFDEPSVLDSFHFEEDKVFYSRKFFKSNVYKKIFTESSFNYVGFATKTDRSIWSAIKSFFNFSYKPVIQNADVNLTKFASHYSKELLYIDFLYYHINTHKPL